MKTGLSKVAYKNFQIHFFPRTSRPARNFDLRAFCVGHIHT